MVDFKDQMKNVAFGGPWSEALVEQAALNDIMQVLDRAAAMCGEEDVWSRDLDRALTYVRNEVEKGPMLVEGFQKALQEPLPDVREARVSEYVKLVRDWSGA